MVKGEKLFLGLPVFKPVIGNFLTPTFSDLSQCQSPSDITSQVSETVGTEMEEDIMTADFEDRFPHSSEVLQFGNFTLEETEDILYVAPSVLSSTNSSDTSSQGSCTIEEITSTSDNDFEINKENESDPTPMHYFSHWKSSSDQIMVEELVFSSPENIKPMPLSRDKDDWMLDPAVFHSLTNDLVLLTLMPVLTILVTILMFPLDSGLRQTAA